MAYDPPQVCGDENLSVICNLISEEIDFDMPLTDEILSSVIDEFQYRSPLNMCNEYPEEKIEVLPATVRMETHSKSQLDETKFSKIIFKRDRWDNPFQDPPVRPLSHHFISTHSRI